MMTKVFLIHILADLGHFSKENKLGVVLNTFVPYLPFQEAYS